MTETISVTIIPDEDGYVGRECPTCERYFKVRPGTGITEQDEAYCPYCGKPAPPSDFLTKEQANYATSIALGEIEEQLLAPLKNFQPTKGLVSIDIKVEGDETPIEHYQERTLETSITCEQCTLEYKIYGVFATCPDCGNHNSRQILRANLSLLRQQLTTADEQQTEDILKNAVSTFDAFGRATSKHHDGTSISFQNLDHAETQLQAHGHSLRAHTTREEWEFLTTSLQKRHVLTHNMGVIDDQYLQRANDPEAIAGRKIRLTRNDVERTIDLLDRLAGAITTAATPPAPITKPRRIGNPYQLTNDALRLAALLFSKDTDGMARVGMSEEDAQAALGIDDLSFDAARRELADHRVLTKDGRWLSSTQYMPLALVDTLDYSPTADDQLVARTAVAENKYVANHELERLTGLPTRRLNHAIRRLEDKRAVDVSTAMGMAPYAFRGVRATGETVRYLKKSD